MEHRKNYNLLRIIQLVSSKDGIQTLAKVLPLSEYLKGIYDSGRCSRFYLTYSTEMITMSTQRLYLKAQGSFIHNSIKLEKLKCLINR